MTLLRADQLVFVPNVGFRLSSGAIAEANVVVEQEGRTLTAVLSSDRDGAEIRMNIAGVSEELDFRQSRPAEAPVRVTDDHGPSSRSGRPGTTCPVTSAVLWRGRRFSSALSRSTASHRTSARWTL